MSDELGRKRTLSVWTFNPFFFLSGEKTLAFGVPAIFLASLLGSFTNSHFDGILDFHTGLAVPVWMFFIEGLVDWLCLATILLLAAFLVSSTRVRMIDLYGNQALARTPAVVISCVPFIPGFTREAMTLLTGPSDFTGNTVGFIAGMLLIIMMTVWMVILMYKGYSTACNVRGARGGISFVLALIAGEVASKAVLLGLYTLFLPGVLMTT